MKLSVFSTSDQCSHHDLTTQLVDYVAEQTGHSLKAKFAELQTTNFVFFSLQGL